MRPLLCRLRGHQPSGHLPCHEDRTFTVKDDECVACNLCVNVCPVDNCITMKPLAKGATDPRTGRRWATMPTGRRIRTTPARLAAE
jgi:NAD-dependent dihydropyrimidine dehydrogenase PreA subunit